MNWKAFWIAILALSTIVGFGFGLDYLMTYLEHTYGRWASGGLFAFIALMMVGFFAGIIFGDHKWV